MSQTFKTENFPAEGIKIAVYEEDKEIGIAIVYIIDNPNRGIKYGMLQEVMISPEHRGKGIGTQLIQKALDTAKDAGCYKVLASSRFERENVHKLYERFGFVKHGFDFRLDLIEVPKQE
jgi:GNAT superfamily N-acetyltransferase